MHLNLLLNSVVGLARLPALARFAHNGWDYCPATLAPLASLALKVLLNATWNVRSVRVKVKSRKEVSPLNKVWSVIQQSKLVISQGTLVGHLKSVMLKDLFLCRPRKNKNIGLISNSFVCLQFMLFSIFCLSPPLTSFEVILHKFYHICISVFQPFLFDDPLALFKKNCWIDQR